MHTKLRTVLLKIARIKHNKCTICNFEETSKHIVTNCTNAKFQWTWLGHLFKCYLTDDNIINHSKYKTYNTYVFNYMISSVKRHLWKTRCEVLYEKKRVTPGLVKLRIIDDLKRKIQSDHKTFTASQFDKLYSNTVGAIWNGNTALIEILNI